MTISPKTVPEDATRKRWHAGRRVCWPLLVMVGLCAGGARADSLVSRGTPAPDLTLTTLGGETVHLAELRGRAVVLLFGELFNANSVAASKDVATLLARPGMAQFGAAVYLIVTQPASAMDLRSDAEQKGVTLPILHDPQRRAYAAYRVVVLPSLVVIGGDGIVALPCAGYPLDFQDIVADTLMYLAGQLSEPEFNRRRAATTQPALPAAHVRAVRLAALGRQLARRGSEELAISTYRDALALHADCVPARIGLGNSLLIQRDLEEAETQFRRALDRAPESLEAALGLIHIQIRRGGEELQAAAEQVREWLRKRPNDARVLYIAARVAEKLGDVDAALGHYKRAAELLLEGQQRRWNLE